MSYSNVISRMKDVIARMKLEEVQNSEEAEGQKIVRCAEHKTGKTHDDAYLFMPREIFQQLQRLVTMRPESPSNHVFVTLDGKELTSAAMHGCLKKVITKSGVGVTKISANMIRRLWVSKVHEEAPHLKDKLSNHMSHSTKTAEKSYRCFTQLEEKGSQYKAISSLLFEGQKAGVSTNYLYLNYFNTTIL